MADDYLAELHQKLARAEAEIHRLRTGIREAVEILDRADAYDTPLYEHLRGLLDGDGVDTRAPWVVEGERRVSG